MILRQVGKTTAESSYSQKKLALPAPEHTRHSFNQPRRDSAQRIHKQDAQTGQVFQPGEACE